MNGRELCGAFYAEAVAPLLGDIGHSAGLLGHGSEVLGFDDERSTDHAFGPRVLLFLTEDAAAAEADITPGLPHTFRGWSTRPVDKPEIGDVFRPLVVTTVASWTTAYLGFDASASPTLSDWLATPTQLLATVAGAAVYHDGLNELRPLQARLEWYPNDLWRYLLAAQWRRIAQEEHFVGRTAMVGDDLGSRLLAGRLARDMIRLAFLIERRHAPYVKWLGTAFRQLRLAAELGPALDAAVGAVAYADREAALVEAYEVVMRATNALELAEPFEPTVRPFFTRGFLVTMGDRIAKALRDAITDADVLALPARLGAIDQYVDSTDVLSYPAALRRFAR